MLLNRLDLLVPEHAELADAARRLTELSIGDSDDASCVHTDLDAFVADVRKVTCGGELPVVVLVPG